MPRSWHILCALALLASAAVVLGADRDKKSPSDNSDANRAAAKKDRPSGAYLGVTVEPLHPSLFGHLPKLLTKGEGVRIIQVAAESPAESAGLEPNDLLVRYDDQKILNPQQLATLVRLDQPGREVTLGVIHEGKEKTVTVKLGAASDEAMPNIWESFDSLTLDRIDGDRYRARISYLNEHGKVESRLYEGTRKEIRKRVDAEIDLPRNERAHLLRALDMPNRQFPATLPTLWVLPDGNVVFKIPELDIDDEWEAGDRN